MLTPETYRAIQQDIATISKRLDRAQEELWENKLQLMELDRRLAELSREDKEDK